MGIIMNFNDRKIKVVHLSEAWTGGVSTYVMNLIKYQNNNNQFLKPYLICSENRTNNIEGIESSANVIKYASSRNPFRFISIAKTINNIICEINPDIIHLHSTYAGIYGRLIPINKKNIKIVYCPHAWSFCQDVSLFKKIAYQFIEAILAKRTDLIINISLNEYSKAHNAMVVAKDNVTILSCVDDVRHSNIEPFEVSDKDINIGFIGRFDKQKGFDYLSKYMKEVKKNNIKVFVLGANDREKSISSYFNDNFNYLGWVDNSIIDDYIKMLDVLVIPSRWEGFCLIALEAMRNSKAIIVSNRTSLPEVVIDGYNGHIFIFEDPSSFIKIIESLNKDELIKMGRNSRAIYEECFKGDRQNKQITDSYYKVINI